MKKLLALTLTVLMLLCTLVSCGGPELYFGKEYAAQSKQVDILYKLNAKSIDVGVMDSIMAGYYMSKSTAYSETLQIVPNLTLATEQYGIGARKGSGLTKKINAALIELAKDGTVDALAEKYGIKSELCIDKNATVAELTEAEKADWNYLVGKGEFIVGYTLFAPIAYEEGNELIGFDIELAKAVAQKLEIAVKFQEISWSAKEALLDAKTIDCIWNGMTITEERQEMMEVSIPYMNNKQVAIIRQADAELYKTTDDMADAIIGAEDGSAGMSCVVKE
jgi:ABC-type amino acid transport substrate-binding protein